MEKVKPSTYRLNIKKKSGEQKSIRINGKYCGQNCGFKGKMFQGYGGWLGFEVSGCKLSGGQLQTNGDKFVRCKSCLDVCRKQVEEKNKQWVKEVG